MTVEKRTVLVVEDERPIALLLAKLVEQCGLKPHAVHSGDVALRWLQDHRPDLILLDLIMPVMSGEELLEELADDPRLADVPVIIITTRDLHGQPLPAHVRYLRKPFQPNEVRQMVSEVLGLS